MYDDQLHAHINDDSPILSVNDVRDIVRRAIADAWMFGADATCAEVEDIIERMEVVEQRAIREELKKRVQKSIVDMLARFESGGDVLGEEGG